MKRIRTGLCSDPVFIRAEVRVNRVHSAFFLNHVADSDQSLRWRLDGIFSILRYLVTVRRATG